MYVSVSVSMLQSNGAKRELIRNEIWLNSYGAYSFTLGDN